VPSDDVNIVTVEPSDIELPPASQEPASTSAPIEGDGSDLLWAGAARKAAAVAIAKKKARKKKAKKKKKPKKKGARQSGSASDQESDSGSLQGDRLAQGGELTRAVDNSVCTQEGMPPQYGVQEERDVSYSRLVAEANARVNALEASQEKVRQAAEAIARANALEASQALDTAQTSNVHTPSNSPVPKLGTAAPGRPVRTNEGTPVHSRQPSPARLDPLDPPTASPMYSFGEMGGRPATKVVSPSHYTPYPTSHWHGMGPRFDEDRSIMPPSSGMDKVQWRMPDSSPRIPLSPVGFQNTSQTKNSDATSPTSTSPGF